MKKTILVTMLLPIIAVAEANRSQAFCEGSKSPLFQSEDVLDLNLQGKFPLKGSYHYITHAENPRTPGILSYKSEDGEKRIPVQLQLRGKSRLQYCQFKPIRILWNEDDSRQDTVFSKLHGKDMKLVDHCGYSSGTIAEHASDNEAVIREYALYKILKALGLPTFEVRLTRMQYYDAKGNPVVQGMGFLLESDASMAKRCHLHHAKSSGGELSKALSRLDKSLLVPYLISRLTVDARDYIVSIGHNTVVFVNDEGEPKLVAPYDFNDSSLVLGRKYDFGFGRSLGSWFALLEQGPFTRDRKVSNLGPGEKEQWKLALGQEANEVLEKKDAALKVIDELPMAASAKQAFRERLESIMNNLVQVAQDSSNP